LTPIVTCRILFPVNRSPVPSKPMRSLKNLLSALAFLLGTALVLGSLAYCIAQLIVGGVN
jgi:hypothetical protein